MTVWGYARVSTIEQDPTLQIAALAAAGVILNGQTVTRGSLVRRPQQ